MAPQWLLLPTAATATPVVRARSIAACMAKAPAIWPMLLPPSITSAAGASLTTRGRPRGSIPPPFSLPTYSGTRITPCEWMPRKSAMTS